MSLFVINPYQQFIDSTGKVRASGIVTFFNNKTTVKASIFSDEALSVAQTNPYTLNANGQIAGDVKYSGLLTVKQSNSDGSDVITTDDVPTIGAQATLVLILGTVAGTNTITAKGTPTITSLVDLTIYSFIAANATTGAVTLQIDATAAKSVKKYHDLALISGDIEANQVISVIYNGTDDVYELLSNVETSGIDDNATAERLQISDAAIAIGATGIDYSIFRTVTDRFTRLSGGTTSSNAGEIRLYGNTHSGQPGDVIMGSGGQDFFIFDESVGDLEILTGIGSKTSAMTFGVTQGIAIPGVLTVGNDILTDADSVDDIGTTSLRFKELFIDTITITDFDSPRSVTKHKTADKSLSANNTLEDDNHLAGWTLDAASYYQITGWLHPISASSTPDIQFAWQLSQTAVAGGWSIDDTSVGSEDDITTALSKSLTANEPLGLTVGGFIQTHATLSTTLDLQWAQFGSNATATILQNGSWITITKMS